MLFKSGFGFGVPDLTFVVREILPSQADYLGQGTVVCLYFGRNMLAFYEGRSEKNEGVGRTGDASSRGRARRAAHRRGSPPSQVGSSVDDVCGEAAIK